MVEITAEVAIKATMVPGAVYYFDDKQLSSSAPHFFIILNNSPSTDQLLVLVCSSSQIAKVRARNINNPPETLVEITPAEYSDFTKVSIVDCNTVFLRTVNDLIKKYELNQLKLKSQIPQDIFEKLKSGVLASNMIPESQKRILR